MRLRSLFQTVAAFAGFLGLAAGAPAAGPPPLQERLERLVRAFPGTLGIAARNLDTGESFAVNGDARFPTASLIKVAVMVETYHQIAEGKFGAETAVVLAESDKAGDEPVVLNQLHPGISLTVSDLLALMIAFSDNTATNLLVRRVGAANVDRRMASYGLPNTKIFRPTFRDGHADVFPEEEKEFGLGMTTPNEIARLRHRHLRPSNQGQGPHCGQPGPRHGSGDVPNGLRLLRRPLRRQHRARLCPIRSTHKEATGRQGKASADLVRHSREERIGLAISDRLLPLGKRHRVRSASDRFAASSREPMVPVLRMNKNVVGGALTAKV